MLEKCPVYLAERQTTMEHKTIIFLFTFISLFGFLISTMPSLMMSHQSGYNETEYTYVTVPDRWDTASIGSGIVISQDMKNVTYGGLEIFTLTDNDNATQDISMEWAAAYGQDLTFYRHKHMYWFVPWYHNMNPYPISKDYAVQYQDDNITAIQLTCDQGDFKCLLQISFNETAYADLEEAWDDGQLEIWLGIRDTDTQTQANFDVWTMLGAFLTLRMPNIHPWLNFILALPIYATLGVCILYILDKILPF